MAFGELRVDSHACLFEEYCSSFQSILKNHFTHNFTLYVFDYFLSVIQLRNCFIPNTKREKATRYQYVNVQNFYLNASWQCSINQMPILTLFLPILLLNLIGQSLIDLLLCIVEFSYRQQYIAWRTNRFLFIHIILSVTLSYIQLWEIISLSDLPN